MLCADKICFHRNGALLLDTVSFSIAESQFVKITGSNGSGKTTLVKILCGLLPADSGTLYWQGQAIDDDADRYREQLLYISHHNGLAEELTPLENLSACAGLRLHPPKQKAECALAAAGIANEAKRYCRLLSAGQKRRAALARLQAFTAALWILDEPFTALDAAGRQMLSGWINTHLAAGGMVICTMHNSDEWNIPAAAVIECGN